MSDMDAFNPSLHHVDQEHEDDATVVGPGPDERSESGIDGEPYLLAALRLWCVRSVIGDEVGGVVVSIDGEEPCGRQPVADLGGLRSVLPSRR